MGTEEQRVTWRRNAALYRQRYPERVKEKKRLAYQRDRETHLAKHRIWNANNRDTRRNGILKRQYGMTLADYRERFAAQGGLCAICGSPEKLTRNGRLLPLAVDHDHESGFVRGLLCVDCNVSLGKMHDDPRLLRAAADYIEQASRQACSGF